MVTTYLITGANRGLGLEFVAQLAAERNNKVFALVRDKERANDLKEISGDIHIIQAEITEEDSLIQAAKEVAAVLGDLPLDYLINNAGLTPGGPNTYKLLTEYPQKDLVKDLQEFHLVNTVAPILVIRAFLPLVERPNSQKKVVLISTGLADLNFTRQTENPALVPYAASKAALEIIVAKLAIELKAREVIVTAVSPGWVSTQTGEEYDRDVKMLLPSFKKHKADLTGPITPQESIRSQLRLFASLTLEEHSGAFLSHNGNKIWL